MLHPCGGAGETRAKPEVETWGDIIFTPPPTVNHFMVEHSRGVSRCVGGKKTAKATATKKLLFYNVNIC